MFEMFVTIAFVLACLSETVSGLVVLCDIGPRETVASRGLQLSVWAIFWVLLGIALCVLKITY